MAELRVTVTALDGSVLYSEVVDTQNTGSNDEDYNLTDVQKVLLIAAPEVCPWDCDRCHQ